MTKTTDPAADDAKNARGPNFPSISLERAVGFAQILYEKEKRAAVGVPVVLSHWGYKNPKSSTAAMALAALKSYGLLDYQGSGPNRLAKLSPRALRIVLNTPERADELKAAALAPKIHQQLWEKYKEDGLPSDEAIKHHLILDLDFNDAAVDGFLGRLRSTFSFANLVKSDTLSDKPLPIVGDFVQWESQGALQLPEARKVSGLSDDGQFVFVEGTSTGLPVGEVVVVKAPTNSNLPPQAAIADMFGMGKTSLRTPAPMAPSTGDTKTETFTLDRGEVVMRWPATMTAQDLQDVEDWLEIVKRKLKRTVQSDGAKSE
jgi:hypothetical protein